MMQPSTCRGSIAPSHGAATDAGLPPCQPTCCSRKRLPRSRGKWAAGLYDPACDDDYEWDDDNRPYGRSCASRPPEYRDKCCSEKNP